MGYPRRLLVDHSVLGYYHCVSRCVRRALLLGGEWDHRRAWIEDRLVELSFIFAIECSAYAILSNHVHIVVRINPDAARLWTALEVARRWYRLFPKVLERVRARASSPEEADRLEQQFLENVAGQKGRIRILRARLADLGWFHKMWKEPLARLANRQDDCTGHFWEGRFKSYRLLDDAAVLACMVYVDLNLFRAGMVQTIEECHFTSLLERLEAVKATQGGDAGTPSRSPASTSRHPRSRVTTWLLPTDTVLGMTTRQYVSLVAHTGGVPIDRQDHDGHLTSLGIDPPRWKQVLTTTARRVGSVVGNAINCLKEAQRRRARRVVNLLDIYRSG